MSPKLFYFDHCCPSNESINQTLHSKSVKWKTSLDFDCNVSGQSAPKPQQQTNERRGRLLNSPSEASKQQPPLQCLPSINPPQTKESALTTVGVVQTPTHPQQMHHLLTIRLLMCQNLHRCPTATRVMPLQQLRLQLLLYYILITVIERVCAAEVVQQLMPALTVEPMRTVTTMADRP